MDNDCVFCAIARGDIPADTVYEDGDIKVFRDLNPAAPVHLLAIPKEHIQSAAALDASNSGVAAKIFVRIAALARELDLKDGFRVVTNAGACAGQTVPHLHFHLLAGRDLGWPPG